MILSGQTIRKLCEMQQLIRPFHERGQHSTGLSFGLGPAGYDVCIDSPITVMPGAFVLASTRERFNIPPTLLMRVCDKSTWARRGIAVQNTVAEPGWRGFLTLEITNHSNSPYTLQRDTPIAQVIFEVLDQAAELPYAGKYQDQPRGPVPAIL